jgi:glycosyltransferase involved in cell wall biosynthesis
VERPPSPIRVLYDVSALAYGLATANQAGGIFRVVREMIEQAARRPELDLHLCCQESRHLQAEIAAYLYRRKHPLRGRLERVWESPLPWPHAWQDTLHRALRTESSSVAARIRRRVHREVTARVARRRPVAGCVDVYHSFWGRLPEPASVNARARILTVYDLIPILESHAFPKPAVDEFTRKIRSVDVHRDWAVCISEHTKRDFCAFTAIDPARVFVMPLAASKDVFYPQVDRSVIDATRAKYRIPTPRYVVSLSTVHPRKGSLQIARCFGRLAAAGTLRDASLIFVGRSFLKARDLFLASGLDPSFEHRILVVGHVPDADLAALCSGARLSAYLSGYEGFGLPPLEAMQCGVPVVTSSTSSLPEVVGDAAIMVAPDDEDAICDAMSGLWQRDDLHQSLSERGLARARQFSWERSMQILADAYGVMLDSG